VITFERDSVRFIFRSAAIIVADGAVLVHRGERDAFWAMPGGRVELEEPAAAALARELLEELGERVIVGDLLWVVENFFEYEGRRCHELGLYFRVDAPDSLRRQARGAEFDGDEGGARLIYRWQPLASLGEIDLRPEFLRSRLGSASAGTTHVIQTPAGASIADDGVTVATTTA
jgi:8-oxo-dGTP pyrophosphatase MutT (NUDIX family)